jgi:hypothetical protein
VGFKRKRRAGRAFSLWLGSFGAKPKLGGKFGTSCVAKARRSRISGTRCALEPHSSQGEAPHEWGGERTFPHCQRFPFPGCSPICGGNEDTRLILFCEVSTSRETTTFSGPQGHRTNLPLRIQARGPLSNPWLPGWRMIVKGLDLCARFGEVTKVHMLHRPWRRLIVAAVV